MVSYLDGLSRHGSGLGPMESEFIHWLRGRLPSHPLLPLGPGDDAAILRWGQNAECVLTVDMLTEGVDFELSKIAPTRVGRKALAVSLSDLAAMAARPLGARWRWRYRARARWR